LPTVASMISLAGLPNGRSSVNQRAFGHSARRPDDLPVPCVGSISTSSSSKTQPGSKTRRTAATNERRPIARVYSVLGAPKYVVSQVSMRLV
jgi:hypothetical protein